MTEKAVVIPKDWKEGTGGKRTMTATVTKAEAPCDCAICKKAETPGEQLHIVLKPTNREWKDQNEWFGISESTDSAFYALIMRLRELGVSAPAGKPIQEVLKGMGEAEWAEEDDVGRKQKPTWMPVKLLS